MTAQPAWLHRPSTPGTRCAPSFTCCSPPAGTPPDVAGHESSRLRTPRVNHPGEQTVGVMTIHPTRGQPHGRADVGGLMTTRAQHRPALLVDWIKNIARRAVAQPPPGR